jgi:hypothetical protein
MRRARSAVLSALALGAGLAPGCLGPLAAVEGGWRHRRHAYTIGRPDGPGAAWERIEVEGALLAFRRPGGETISMQSRCGRPVASAQLMARHLVIGIRERELVADGPVPVDGRSGWSQSFDMRQEGVRVRVKTVTLVAGECAFDWVLATRGPAEPAEAAFDAWWQSFRLDPRRWAEAPG